jgi:hypothetical protein
VCFGVLSIAQPEVSASESEFPVFTGFYAVFPDFQKNGDADSVYGL